MWGVKGWEGGGGRGVYLDVGKGDGEEGVPPPPPPPPPPKKGVLMPFAIRL